MSLKATERYERRKRFIEAAIELFKEKGGEISVSDITKKVDLAKGTFYLYFKDKNEFQKLSVLKLASNIIDDALDSVNNKEFEEPIDKFMGIIDFIIKRFSVDSDILNIIHKNLSWSLFEKILSDESYSYESSVMKNFIEYFCNDFKYLKYTVEELRALLFIIFEIVNSSLYSSILYNEPLDIKDMTPIIKQSIKKLLTN